MKVWLPFVRSNCGTDLFTESLATALERRGVQALTQRFPQKYQYVPSLLRRIEAPRGTNIVLANTWNAFAFKRPGVKLVAVEHLLVHDPAYDEYKSRAQAAFHRVFVRRFELKGHRQADQIVAVSQYTANAYRDCFGTDAPRVILNGIDTDFFCPATQAAEGLDSRPFRLLFVGKLSRRKGFDLLPTIMSFLGGGFELSYTHGPSSADPFKNMSGFRRLGRLDSKRVREEMRRADLLLFPTRLEGAPLVVMEAMACQTPVVSSNVVSPPEIIEHGVTGVLCNINDAEGFSRAVRRLRDNPIETRRMGIAARKAIVERCSIDRMADEYLQLFREFEHA